MAVGRWRMLLGLGAVALVLVALRFTVFDRDGGNSIGPEGGSVSEAGVTVDLPEGAIEEEAEVTIERIDADASELLPGLEPRSDAFSVEIDQPLARPAEVSLPLGEGVSPEEVLAVADRDADGEMWTLQEATAEDDGTVARFETDHFTDLQALVNEATGAANKATGAAIDFGVTATSTFLQFGGTRVSEPACGSPPAGFALEGDTGTGDANALSYACLEQADEDMALRISNNRGIGMEVDVPEDLEVADLDGPELPDELLDITRRALTGSRWQTISAAGSATLRGPPAEMELTVKPTLRAFVFDLGVAALGQLGGRVGREAEAVAEYLGCVRGGADSLGDGVPESAQAALDAAKGVWRYCGSTLARAGASASQVGAVFFGGVRLGTGSVDALAALLTDEKARLVVAEAPIQLLFAPDGLPSAVGSFEIASGERTIGDAIADFGEPDSLTQSDTGCEVRWDAIGLKADAVNYGDRHSECEPTSGYINDFVVLSDRFATDVGLTVGMSEEELEERYPDATTRGPPTDAAFDDEHSPSGSLYSIYVVDSPIARYSSLKALVQDGEVKGLEVTALLGGD